MAMRFDIACSDPDENQRWRCHVVRATEELDCAKDVSVLLADTEKVADAFGNFVFGELSDELRYCEHDERTPIAFTVLYESPNRLKQ
jgi:hypothetical protein